DLQKYQSIKDQNRRIYAAMVDSMDQAIGRILKAIDNKGIKENTFVLFFSDNGGITRWADNGSWRAGKGTVYEGGVRTVAAVRWPAGFRGERTIDAMMGYIDIFPTLMALVSSEEKLSKPLDGRNMLGVTGGSVLDAKIGKAKPKIELFHLLKDPVESNDLAKQEPEKVEAMLRRMKDHRRLKIAGIPDFLEGKKGFVAPKNWVITD
ncbi:MAG: sulfatase-like hydrolase/transferase, partial [Akkermansiaceae bacterium]